MPIGLNGEERPANVVANAVHLARIATGEAEEEHVNSGKSAGGRKGGVARAKSMTAGARLPDNVLPRAGRTVSISQHERLTASPLREIFCTIA